MLPLVFSWPWVLLRDREEDRARALGLVAAEVALAYWLAGGAPARTAAYAAGLLFLPPLVAVLVFVAMFV